MVGRCPAETTPQLGLHHLGCSTTLRVLGSLCNKRVCHEPMELLSMGGGGLWLPAPRRIADPANAMFVDTLLLQKEKALKLCI